MVVQQPSMVVQRPSMQWENVRRQDFALGLKLKEDRLLLNSIADNGLSSHQGMCSHNIMLRFTHRASNQGVTVLYIHQLNAFYFPDAQNPEALYLGLCCTLSQHTMVITHFVPNAQRTELTRKKMSAYLPYDSGSLARTSLLRFHLPPTRMLPACLVDPAPPLLPGS